MEENVFGLMASTWSLGAPALGLGMEQHKQKEEGTGVLVSRVGYLQ